MADKNTAVNQSVERACYILDLFTAAKPEWSLAEIAKACSIAVTTVMPLLKALENSFLLERNAETKKYRLGMRFVEKGQLVLSGIDLRELAATPSKELAAKFNATSHLGISDGCEVVIIDRYDRKQELIDTFNPAFIGKRLPLHSTALGLVLAAYGKLKLQTSPEKYTPYTVVELKELEALLQRVKSQGYAVDDEMNQLNGICVAAPIFSHNGSIKAALSLSMIKNDARMRQLPEIISEVRKSALEISYKMGYKG